MIRFKILLIKKYSIAVMLLMGGLLIAVPAFSQFRSDSLWNTINETEAEVLPYTLPDPLLMENGRRVQTEEQWTKTQRPYLYHLFEENVYGRYPTAHVPICYKVREESQDALGGIATRKQVRIFLKPGVDSVYIDVLMYLPNDAAKPVPVFLGLNFTGNATMTDDPHVFLSDRPAYFYHFRQPNTKSDRGKRVSRWPVKTILARGFGVVTGCYGDIEPDHRGGWKTGIRNSMKDVLHISPQQWGAIGAWAWGLSEIMDYLEKDGNVNAKKVAVYGHSRLGKTVLWAGASDPRFSIVISNDSGEGGAALARRWYGQTVNDINTRFPYWFVGKFHTYSNNVFALPVDQHELLALIAPRPLYIGAAAGNPGSDPKGMFLSAWHAGQVYRLFGEHGLGSNTMPTVNHPIGHTIHYHIRTGRHDITKYDWKQYLKFATKQWEIK